MSIKPVSEDQIQERVRQRQLVREKQKAYQDEQYEPVESNESSTSPIPTVCQRLSKVPGKVPGGGFKGRSGWIAPDTRVRVKLREKVKKPQSTLDAAREQKYDYSSVNEMFHDDTDGEKYVEEATVDSKVKLPSNSSAKSSQPSVARTESLYHDATRRALRRELAKVSTAHETSFRPELPASVSRSKEPRKVQSQGVFPDSKSWAAQNPFGPGTPRQLPKSSAVGIFDNQCTFKHKLDSKLFDDHHEASVASGLAKEKNPTRYGGNADFDSSRW